MTDKGNWQRVVKVFADPNMPAFGGYVAGSMSKGEPIMYLNLPAFVGVKVGEGMSAEELATLMAETIMHECFHAVQEFCGLAFSDEQVDGWIKAFTPTPEASDE